MKGCLRCTRCVLHQRRDKGGNTHNFPFDTLTKVYRDTMYATQEHYQGNPMYPERGPQGSTAATAGTTAQAVPPHSSPRRSDVTNHVGKIGVMSPAATPLSQFMEELDDHHDGHHRHADKIGVDGDDDAHAGHQHSPSGRVSSSPSPSRHTRIVRSAPPSPQTSSAAPSSSAAAEDEAVRQRLRTHLFSKKKGNKTRASQDRDSVGSAAPRHSGVQVEILNVYRSMLREVSRMEDPDTRRNLTAYIRSEFEKQRDVPRKNILKIEWQLNYGKRKLEDLQAMGKHTRFSMMR